MKHSLLFLFFVLLLVFNLQSQTRSAKRGVSFGTENPYNMDDLKALSTTTSWFYNWGTTVSSSVSSYESEGYDFYPMAFRENFSADNIRRFKQQHPECEYILTFNEPNLTDQANMTPAQAAAAWPALKKLANDLGMKLISPAMNFGTLTGYSDPVKWLDEFFAQPGVSIDDVDGIAIHSYMTWSLEWFINTYFSKYGKPIWVTEYCAWSDFNNGTPKAQLEAMVRFINLMETRPDVVRYAWFLGRAKDGETQYPYHSLLTKTLGKLSTAGLIYANLSSYDDNFYFDVPCRIPAEHYISMNGIYFEKTTDDTGEISGYTDTNNQNPEITYNVNIPESKEYMLNLRIQSGNGKIEIYENSKILTTLNYTSTGGQWATLSVKLPLSAGKQKIRFAGFARGFKLNWWEITNENPANLSSVLPDDSIVKCILRDINGRILSERKDKTAINMNAYPAGVYILSLHLTNGKIINQKIINTQK